MPAQISLMHVLEATVGGTKRHLLDLCLNLPAERFRQYVVCSVRREERFRQDLQKFQEAGIDVFLLPMRREIHLWEDGRCALQLRKIIQDIKPAIVHGHSSKGGFLARLASRSVRPVPHTVYNPHAFAFQMRVGPFHRWLYLKLEQWAGRWTDMLVAPCESQKELALAHHIIPPERIRVIPNGIRVEQYVQRGAPKQLRVRWGLPEEGKIVGTVAALSPQKGLEYLIRAIAAVRREHPDVHLVMAGDGPLHRTLEQLAQKLGTKEGVHFLGYQEDIPALLGALDIFVMPSLWEGLPYALLEAGAAGLPVIATAIPGNTDIIIPEQTGLLVPPADYFALTIAIIRALTDPQMQTMARALRERVCNEFTLERMIQGHIQLYEELAKI